MQKQKDNLWKLRHSTEHVLHQAVNELYPSIHLAMGPATDEGFYFDFDSSPDGKEAIVISEADFPKIEKLMKKIIARNLSITGQEVTENKAREMFKGNPYKQEWIDKAVEKGQKITIYWTGKPDENGSMVDLCAGPHIESTGKIKAFKLLSVAGAYWHGDEKNKMLTRIYGTAFETKEELEKYLWQIEEAKKRDHRNLGKQLDLYSISDLTGPGLILWHPKLATVRNVVETFWKQKHIEHGYSLVYTPNIATMDMFVISRHYSKYINSMFPAMLHENIEGESKPDYVTDEQLKPMNCPNHIQIYKAWPKSYRELPVRLGELGTVYRYERKGTLHGMTRVRGFTQDDSHIFCRLDQVISEIKGVLKLTKELYEVFGFKQFKAYLATRPEKYLGDIKMWDFAEDSLKKALEEERIEYTIEKGDGAFYGPKIDSKIQDSVGREWQLGTIQFDFNMPDKAETTQEDIEEFWAMKTFKEKFTTKKHLEKYLNKLGRGFDVQYVNEKGDAQQVVMIHRTILGSMERFFGILIEHYAGAFPLWLAPIQVELITIAERHTMYAQKIAKELQSDGIRVEVDDRNERMQAKIREATLQKIPYIGIIGDNEINDETISIRTFEGKDLGALSVSKFSEQLTKEIEKKI